MTRTEADRVIDDVRSQLADAQSFLDSGRNDEAFGTLVACGVALELVASWLMREKVGAK